MAVVNVRKCKVFKVAFEVILYVKKRVKMSFTLR
jgi:hypothetical protein